MFRTLANSVQPEPPLGIGFGIGVFVDLPIVFALGKFADGFHPLFRLRFCGDGKRPQLFLPDADLETHGLIADLRSPDFKPHSVSTRRRKPNRSVPISVAGKLRLAGIQTTPPRALIEFLATQSQNRGARGLTRVDSRKNSEV